MEELQRTLGRIEGSLTALHTSNDKRDARIDTILADHEKRTRWLERKINGFTALAAVVSAYFAYGKTGVA